MLVVVEGVGGATWSVLGSLAPEVPLSRNGIMSERCTSGESPAAFVTIGGELL